MDITPLVPANKNLIQAYASSYIVIKEKRYYIPIIISPDQIIINPDDEYSFKELNNIPEILLLGYTNGKLPIKRPDINIEIMSFGAACRTYNILLTEGREVACLLI